MKYGLLLAKNGNDNALAFLAALTEFLPFDIRQLLVQQSFRWQLSGERELPLHALQRPTRRKIFSILSDGLVHNPELRGIKLPATKLPLVSDPKWPTMPC